MKQELQEQLIIRCIKSIEDSSVEKCKSVYFSLYKNYLSTKIYEDESEYLFRRIPQMVAHVSELPKVGSYLTKTIQGTNLLVVRDEDSILHIFKNICRHRAAKVELDKNGLKNRFICPYHGWCYRLNGSLMGMHRKQCFKNISNQDMQLIELKGEEHYGFLWLMPKNGESLVDYIGELGEELGMYELEKYGLYRDVEEKTWNMNWKLAQEGALETYHFRFAHRRTLFPLFANDAYIYDFIGNHIRGILPKRYITDLKNREKSEWNLFEQSNVMYTIFPNQTLLFQSDHLAWITFTPLAVDKTEIAIRLLIPSDQKINGEAQDVKWERNMSLTCRALHEDFTIQESIQKGIVSQPDSFMKFGSDESALGKFNDRVKRYVTDCREAKNR